MLGFAEWHCSKGTVSGGDPGVHSFFILCVAVISDRESVGSIPRPVTHPSCVQWSKSESSCGQWPRPQVGS